MHILLNHSVMFDIATRMSHSMSILLRYFDLITATAEKPALHKFDIANGTRTRRALQPTSGNEVRRKIDKLFSFQRCKPLRGVCIINKRFVIQLCFSMSSEKYFSKCEIRTSKCEHITVFISHSSVFCRERLLDCEFRWDFKSEKLSHC